MDADVKASARRRRARLRAVEQASLIRWWLFDTMGWCCANCGTIANVELDHPHGRNWEPRNCDCVTRAKRYLRDWADGNLRILCRTCNAKDGGRRGGFKRPKQVARALAPQVAMEDGR